MMLAELSSVQNMPMARPPGNVISRRPKCMPRGGAPSSVYNYAGSRGGGVLGGGWRRRSRDGEHAGVTHIIWQVREVLHHAPGRSAGQPLEDHGGKARGLHEKVPVRDRWHNGQPARAPVHFTSTYHTVTWVLPLRPTRVSCPQPAFFLAFASSRVCTSPRNVLRSTRACPIRPSEKTVVAQSLLPSHVM